MMMGRLSSNNTFTTTQAPDNPGGNGTINMNNKTLDSASQNTMSCINNFLLPHTVLRSADLNKIRGTIIAILHLSIEVILRLPPLNVIRLT